MPLVRGKVEGIKPPDIENGNEVVLELGFVSLVIVIEAGKITAPDARDRSWFPPAPSSPTKRVWNGEPPMLEADVPTGQSRWSPMCPPQARTTVEFAAGALNVIVIWLLLSPAKLPVGVYPDMPPTGMVPPNIVNAPSICVPTNGGPRVGSGGIPPFVVLPDA